MIIKGYASELHIRSEIEVITDNSIVSILFHTTSKVEVNGQGMELFLTHIEDIKERMKSRGNYKIYNKQIEEQINIIKRNEADIEIRGKHPTRTQITKEETGNSNTEVLDMLEMNKTASYKQHKPNGTATAGMNK
ncbi:Hypothetical predicted protein [Mytilus galloprovincialis]|uniref:Uncharacterized protein n=1 Tax=Mytilus galloprovincialis TaxID=29158 RepID=A0A8B6FGV7_MYTGA|nr:Hypothetical predicted protein [Mytilus galloprovincialis]